MTYLPIIPTVVAIVGAFLAPRKPARTTRRRADIFDATGMHRATRRPR